MRRTRTLLPLLSMAVVTLAACGDGGLTGTDGPFNFAIQIVRGTENPRLVTEGETVELVAGEDLRVDVQVQGGNGRPSPVQGATTVAAGNPAALVLVGIFLNDELARMQFVFRSLNPGTSVLTFQNAEVALSQLLIVRVLTP